MPSIPVIVLAASLFVLCLLILSLLLPNFSQQKKMKNIATMLLKTEAERDKMMQNQVLVAFTDRLEKKKWFFSLGAQLKAKFDLLGRSESFALYMTKTIMYSTAAAVIGLVRYVLSPQPIVLALPPVLFILVWYLRNRNISVQYKKRETKLIADLPNLISKMISALEVGKPLTDIFRKVAAGDNPLLSGLLKKLLANTEAMSIQDAMLIFAKDVNIPVIYDFVGVVNIVIEKGFTEAEKDLRGIKDDLRELRLLSLQEQTKGNPGKMNAYYIALLLLSGVFFCLCAVNIGSMLFGVL